MNTEPNPASSGGDDEGRLLPYPELTDQDFLEDALGTLRDHADTGGYEEGVFSERDELAAYLLYLANENWPNVYAELDSEIVVFLDSVRYKSGTNSEGEQKSGGNALAAKEVRATEAIRQLEAELEDTSSRAGIIAKIGLFSLRMSDAAPWLFDYDREAEPVHPLAQRIHDLRSDLKKLGECQNENNLKRLRDMVYGEGSFATDEGRQAAMLLYKARFAKRLYGPVGDRGDDSPEPSGSD